MKNDLIVIIEDTFMEGAMASFSASDPRPTRQALRSRARRPRTCRRAEVSPRFDSTFACHATGVTEKQGREQTTCEGVG